MRTSGHCATCGALTEQQPCHNCHCVSGFFQPTAFDKPEKLVLFVLLRETVVPACRFAKEFGLGGPPLRKAVNNLRNRGVPILSGAGGYWLCYNPADIRIFTCKEKNRASSIISWCDRLNESADILEREATEDAVGE